MKKVEGSKLPKNFQTMMVKKKKREKEKLGLYDRAQCQRNKNDVRFSLALGFLGLLREIHFVDPIWMKYRRRCSRRRAVARAIPVLQADAMDVTEKRR